jgi:hypothetical protein
MVTLYDSSAWLGPNHSYILTTPSPQTLRNPVQTLRVTPSHKFYNRGYGYENNTDLQINKSLNGHPFHDRSHIPITARFESRSDSFSCEHMQYYGYYADIKSGCRVSISNYKYQFFSHSKRVFQN